MYYVIHDSYVGPDTSRSNEEFIYISTEPPKENLSGDVKDVGWCGTTNNVSKNALGSYLTLDEAKLKIHERFNGYREGDEYGFYADLPLFSHDVNIVFVSKPGIYEIMSTEQTEMWFGEIYQDYVFDYSTDKDIYDLVVNWEQEVLSGFKCQLDITHAIGFLINYRDELIEENKYD